MADGFGLGLDRQQRLNNLSISNDLESVRDFADAFILALEGPSSQRYAMCMLRQESRTIAIRAPRQGLHEFTVSVQDFVGATGIREGLLTLFCSHTSASLLIQENAAPAVRRDLHAFFERIAPEDGSYEHDEEGADDMPAHLRTALTATHLSIPVKNGRLLLGTWQGIFLFEHRRNTPERSVALHLVGE